MANTPYLRIQIPVTRKEIGAKDIVQATQKELQSGLVSAGVRLPPIRMIAHQLGISKNTVQAAYEELEARGLIVSRARSGYFVQAKVSPESKSIAKRKAPAPVLFTGKFPPVIGTSKNPNKIIPLGSVFIDRELLPISKIEQCFRSVLKAPGLHYLYDTQGFEPLRKIIAKRLNARGISADPGNVIITTG